MSNRLIAITPSIYSGLSASYHQAAQANKKAWLNDCFVFFAQLQADMGVADGLSMPLRDMPDGLSEGVDDDGGFAVAEALDGEVVGLVGVVGGVPKADDDAVVGKVRADTLADGAGLGEGEGRQGGDEDDGVGFVGEGVEDLAGDGGAGRWRVWWEARSMSWTSMWVVSSSA